MILQGLLMGLASKLRFYTGDGLGGYTATIRRMYQFVKAKRYPCSWWVRPLTLALVRVGAALPCLPLCCGLRFKARHRDSAVPRRRAQNR